MEKTSWNVLKFPGEQVCQENSTRRETRRFLLQNRKNVNLAKYYQWITTEVCELRTIGKSKIRKKKVRAKLMTRTPWLLIHETLSSNL